MRGVRKDSFTLPFRKRSPWPAHHGTTPTQGATMNRSATFRGIAAAALGLVALAATTASHARTDVQVSIGIPGVYVQPAPVYVQPRPVYVQPQPVYVHPVHAQRGAWGDRDRDGVPNAYDRWDNRGHGYYANHPRADSDRDGVPNRYDRFPRNPNRR
jgi:hypothetical protein